MVIVSSNPKLWLAGVAVSLVTFLIVLFAVILPANDTANNAIKSGFQQSQQALNQSQQQINSAQKQASGSPAAGQASAAGTKASQTLSNAQKLTSCLSSAGTDLAKAQSCQTQYGH